MVESDHSAAKSCIARAFALVQAERDRAALRRNGQRPANFGGLAPWQVRRLADHIVRHLEGPIRTTELAEISQLSPSYFSTVFRRSFGEPVRAYIRRRRVARAMELMLTTEEPLSQIALACGLCDRAHLSRIFLRVNRTSPAAWRHQMGGAPREDALRQLEAPDVRAA